MIIDTHQHFWRGRVPAYDKWMTGRLQGLSGRHMPEDLAPELVAAGVTATVAVQSWGSVEETHEYLRIADTHEWVVGVVGWLDLTAPSFTEDLDALRGGRHGEWLRGIRHTVDLDERPEWFSRPDVRTALRTLGDFALAYDLLVRPNYLVSAAEAVEACPGTQFVLDHCGKPPVGDSLDNWKRGIEGLSRHPNVACKLSGLLTLSPTESSSDNLRPIVDEILQAFGPERVMFGSDWPVSSCVANYSDVTAQTTALIDDLSPVEKAGVLSANAQRVYKLLA